MTTTPPLIAYLTHDELARIRGRIDKGYETLQSMREFFALMEGMAGRAVGSKDPLGGMELAGLASAFEHLAHVTERVSKDFGAVKEHLGRAQKR